MLSMQLSGIDVIYYYSTSIFRSAGLVDPQMATTSLGLLNVLLTLLSVCTATEPRASTLHAPLILAVISSASYLCKLDLTGLDWTGLD